MVERLFHLLISGDRVGARTMVAESLNSRIAPEDLSHEAFWPAMEMINSLYRSDQLSTLAHHYGTRLLRSLVDQMQPHYTQSSRRNKSILMFCGASEEEELAATLVADLAEADGYTVYLGGSGVSNDEVLAEVGRRRPDVLLMFASAASDAPNIRQLIDTIREINACSTMQIAVGGGVFNRAEGLAEEIGADLWAASPHELLHLLHSHSERRATAEQRTVGRNRRTNVKSEAA
jgi:methanogenic corrinoid protein MtbC1